MYDADAISRVKTGELYVDSLIADAIKKFNFRKWMRYISLFWTLAYLQILYVVLHQKYLVLYKKKLWCQKKGFQDNLALENSVKFCTMFVYGV